MNKFFCIIILCKLFVKFSRAKTYLISCGDCIATKRNDFGNCFVKSIAWEYYSGPNDIPAPKAKIEDLSVWTYVDRFGSVAISINVTWSQSGSHFMKTNGYILSATGLRTAYRIIQNVTVNPLSSINLGSLDKVVINQPCLGTTQNVVKADESVLIKIRSMPSYQPNTRREDNEVEHIMPIKCTFLSIENATQCRSKEYLYDSYLFSGDSKETELTTVAAKSNAWIHQLVVPVTTVGSFLLLVILITITVCCLRRKNFQRKSSVLLLISTFDKEDYQDHHYLKAADKLCNILKQNGAVDVITNVWNDVNISEPLEWFDENVKNCKHIVLVCTPLGKKNWMKKNMNDMFVMGYQMYRKQRIKKRWFSSSSHKFSVIYFDANSTVCIPEEMNMDKMNHANISNHLSLFFTKMTKKSLNTNSNLVVELKSVIQSIQSARSFRQTFEIYEEVSHSSCTNTLNV